ncbi:MAG: hypothetical protein K6E33_04725 [Lachnospiraceae bacterium]|nr:hypothetical protein [Lachnospiraceae bacterium]
MALKDEIREQRKSLKGKGIKAHISWFVTYYGMTVVLGIIASIILIYFLYTVFTAKKQGFGIVMINASSLDLFTESDAGEELASAFSEYAGIDPNKETVLADLNERLDISEDMDYQTVERIFALSASNQLDVLTADPEVYDYYSGAQTFEDLRNFLTEEELSYFEKNSLLYYSDSKDSDGNVVETHVPTGVYCTGSEALSRVDAFEEKECITGIIAGSLHPDRAVLFIKYLTGT